MNVLDDGYGLCRSMNADYPQSLYRELEKEKNFNSPNGYLTQPYSRRNWDKYWNDRVFYVWDIGSDSCGETYVGVSGPEIIALMLQRRKEMELPEISWDDRNIDKEL